MFPSNLKYEIIRLDYEQKDQVKKYSRSIQEFYKEISLYCKKNITDVLFGGLTTKTYSFDDDIDVYDFTLNKEESIYFIIDDKNKEKPFVHGYVQAQIKEAHEDIGQISQLEGLCEDSRTIYRNNKCQMVLRDNLKKQNGFSQYTGRGKLLNIGYAEFFDKNFGFDKEFFKHIQNSNEFEIIESEFCKEEILIQNKFIDTGIIETGEEDLASKVFVWNNPLYKR
jgi:hypothetical protein